MGFRLGRKGQSVTEVTDRIGVSRCRRFRPYSEQENSGFESLEEISANRKLRRLRTLYDICTGLLVLARTRNATGRSRNPRAGYFVP